jgi:hypothetical protein
MESSDKMQISAKTTLAVAMTTAPRRAPTLPRALSSLRRAGFDEVVHVFAEPGTWGQVPRPSEESTVVHDHSATLGCFDNWRFALTCLLSRTTAPWLLVVQDDAVWAPGSASALRAETVARQDLRTGFLSSYVTASDVPPGSIDGWNECRSGWNLCGALALCVPRDAAGELLRHHRFVRHPKREQVDAVVAESMLDLGRPSYVHVPSLVDHVGETSTLGHDDVSPKLRGYRFGGT